MKVFRDKTAVITGAGSGIGEAIAMRCATEGMNVVLADVNQERLSEVEASLRDIGAKTLTVRTDVSCSQEVDHLAQAAFQEFGAVHLLCNNAGVLHVAPLLEHTAADWEWSVGVNLFGVINGVRIFGPLMAAQPEESHIVNTASLASFTTGPGLAAYKVTKHAVLALSEVLFHELAGQNVGVTVLCPGWVDTNITDMDASRPFGLLNPDGPLPASANREQARKSAKAGASASSIALELLEGVRRGDFYVITESSFHQKLEMRSSDVLARRNPTTP